MCFVILVIYVKVLTTIQYKLWKEKLFKRCPHYQTRIFVNEKKGKHIIGPVELFELHYYHGSFTHKRCQATKQTQFFFPKFSHLRKPAPHFFHPKASPVIFSLSVAHMYTARLFCHCLCLHNDEGAFQGGRPLNKQTWLPITPCSSGMQMSGNKW